MSVDETVERFGRLCEAGVDDLILSMGNDADDAVYPLLADVVRQVESLTTPERTQPSS